MTQRFLIPYFRGKKHYFPFVHFLQLWELAHCDVTKGLVRGPQPADKLMHFRIIKNAWLNHGALR